MLTVEAALSVWKGDRPHTEFPVAAQAVVLGAIRLIVDGPWLFFDPEAFVCRVASSLAGFDSVDGAMFVLAALMVHAHAESRGALSHTRPREAVARDLELLRRVWSELDARLGQAEVTRYTDV
jgi:hypothetical protein